MVIFDSINFEIQGFFFHHNHHPSSLPNGMEQSEADGATVCLKTTIPAISIFIKLLGVTWCMRDARFFLMFCSLVVM